MILSKKYKDVASQAVEGFAMRFPHFAREREKKKRKKTACDRPCYNESISSGGHF